MKDNNNKSQNVPSKGLRIFKSVLNTIITIIIVLILVASLLIAAFALTSKSTGVSTVFGYTIQTIQTDSMKGGSTEFEGGDFKKGDIIIGKAVSESDYGHYEVGDIITYYGVLKGTDQKGLICHRIIEVNTLDNGTDNYYITKGDNNFDTDTEPVYDSDIKSIFYNRKYHGTIIKGLGNVLDYVQTQQGFFFVILLPMIVFFIYAMARVILSATNYRKAKSKEEEQQAEEVKQNEIDAAVAAALAAQNGADAKPADAPAEMTPEQMEQFKQFLAFQEAQKAQQAEQTAPETPAEDKASLD